MITKTRVPKELLEDFQVQMDSEVNDNPLAQVVMPIELSILAGIPVRNRKSFQLDPVLHELIRLYNARINGCQYCQNFRQAIAVQAGLNEDMVSKLANFETSDLPEATKAALRLVSVQCTSPAMLTDDILDQAREYFTDSELVDIILLTMHTSTTKSLITLGLDPGKEGSNGLFFPTESGLFGDNEVLAEAIEDLRKRGYSVEGPTEERLPLGTDIRPGITE